MAVTSTPALDSSALHDGAGTLISGLLVSRVCPGQQRNPGRPVFKQRRTSKHAVLWVCFFVLYLFSELLIQGEMFEQTIIVLS